MPPHFAVTPAPMSHHIVLSGSFSTGKSSLMKALRETYPELESEFLIIEDGGRWWLNKLKESTSGDLAADTLDMATRRQMQMAIFDHYVTAMQQAEAEGKRLLTDAFFAEVFAYSIDCVSPEELTRMEIMLAEHAHKIRAYVLPVSHVQLDKDGLRHEDEQYRSNVEQTLLRLYEKHGIQCRIAGSSILEQRIVEAGEVMETAYVR